MENEETSLAAMFALLPKVTSKHITDSEGWIEKILLHLPAKSVLRLRRVCKGWSKMIQQPRSKKLHFEHNSRKSEPTSQLLVLADMRGDEELRVLDEVLQPSNIWMPQDLGGDHWRFVGCCDGLLCIKQRRRILIFNPLTHDVLSLPGPTKLTGWESIDDTFVELVFHHATSEYKVILFYRSFAAYVRGAIFMYTLGANSSWRYIGQATSSGVNVECPTGPGVNADDTVYWPYQHLLTLDPDSSSFIISFDLNTEQIGKVSLLEQDAINPVGLTNWDGKLCVASIIKEQRRFRMSIFDNSEWTLKHEFQLPEVIGDFGLLAPYSIKSDRVFIWTARRIYYHEISGNPDNIQEIPVQHFGPNKQCFAYVESLLPVPK